jgi:hypothetical protein
MNKVIDLKKERSAVAKNSPIAIASLLYIVIFMTNF